LPNICQRVKDSHRPGNDKLESEVILSIRGQFGANGQVKDLPRTIIKAAQTRMAHFRINTMQAAMAQPDAGIVEKAGKTICQL